MSLLNNSAASSVGDAVSAGSSIDNDSSTVDMAGFDGVVFYAKITDSVATGVATLTAEDGAASNGSDAAAISGAVDALTCAVNDDINGQLLAVDVYRPQGRYVRVNRASATANIAYGDVIAVRYNGPRKLPATHTGTAVVGS